MPKQLYRYCPARSGHRVKIGRKTYLKADQCIYLTPEEADTLPHMRPVDPDTGEFLDLDDVKPEPIVIIEIPPEPVKEEDILTLDPVEDEPEPEVLDVPVAKKKRRARKPRASAKKG